MTDNASFSRRHGFGPPNAEITTREDAPSFLRDALVMLGIGPTLLSPNAARLVICRVLLLHPDPNNWSDYPNVFLEVQGLLAQAPWYRVYEIAEAFYSELHLRKRPLAEEFEHRLNDFFREHGIGWQMTDGLVSVRGSEAFGQAVERAKGVLADSGLQTAQKEIHEALVDLSRRPGADITGAIQHAMAALECVARQTSGRSNETLGRLIPCLELPKPLDVAVEKLWGFASEQGRHIREGREPRFEDAELVVTVASAVSVFLLRRSKEQELVS